MKGINETQKLVNTNSSPNNSTKRSGARQRRRNKKPLQSMRKETIVRLMSDLSDEEFRRLEVKLTNAILEARELREKFREKKRQDEKLIRKALEKLEKQGISRTEASKYLSGQEK